MDFVADLLFVFRKCPFCEYNEQNIINQYASRVQCLSARASDGKTLAVTQPQKNRWRIETKGATNVIVSYQLLCNGRSVTTNWVGEDLLALNGAAAFITLVERARRPHEVRLELPPQWKRAMSGLDAAPDGRPNHFRAADYDTLVDSPIVAGALSVREFESARRQRAACGFRKD